MKFIADENISKTLVHAIRAAGYDIISVSEKELFGLSDKDILKFATREERIILTHDNDFLNISRATPKSIPGVILLRFSRKNPEIVIQRFLPLLNSGFSYKFKDSLVIITDTHVEIIH